MRGVLPEDKIQEIMSLLPVTDDRLFLATRPTMRLNVYDAVSNKKLGIALICLSDACDRFSLVRASLREAYACLAWHRQASPDAPNEIEAVSTCKYYVDYAALLLYAAAEDIAFFIIHALDIESSLKIFLQDPHTQRTLEKKKISSNAGKVGLFLKERFASHAITAITASLHKNVSWKQTLDYRNTWVHSKPPIIDGLGIQHARKNTVVLLDDGTQRRSFGKGDVPVFTVDELLKLVHSATQSLAIALSSFAEIVIASREAIGEHFDFDHQRISFTPNKAS